MTEGITVVDHVTGQMFLVERNGANLKITGPKGALTEEVTGRLAESKAYFMEILDLAKQYGWRPAVPDGTKWMTPAEYKAKMLNRLFDTLGNSKWPSRITAATVEHGEKVRRQPSRWRRKQKDIPI